MEGREKMKQQQKQEKDIGAALGAKAQGG